MRYFSLFVGLMVLSFSACAEQSAPASSAKFVEGKHYLKMLAPVPTIVDKSKVEITEIFRFGCPACYRFELEAGKWKKTKPAAAELVRNPVVWNKDTAVRAQVYYTGEKLGKGNETAIAIFEAMHKNAPSPKAGQRAMLKEDEILTMFVGLGVDKEKAQKMYNNWFIKSKVNQADSRARAFAVSGTPEIFVDGRYRITTSTAGSYAGMLEVASYLVEKIAAERGIK